MPLSLALITIGCRANQSDSAWLARQLDPALVEVVAPKDDADLYLINTCAVTAAAIRDARKAASRIRRRRGEGARILLTGCAVTVAPDDVKEIEGVWAIVPAVERGRIPEMIHQLARELDAEASSVASCADFHPLPPPLHRARPTLRVQDGCQQRCAYCAVPAGRGRERSMDQGEIRRRLHHLAGEGAREVVVCGVNLGRWGRDLTPKRRLADLLDLLAERPLVERIRLSSIEPWALDSSAIEAFSESSTFASHLHLPLQSGDDEVLRRMKRPYRGARFEELASRLVEARPELSIGTDLMVGFPGETNEAFERTAALIERSPVAYLHVFGFSPRPGTPAFDMPDRLDPRELKRRVARLREIGAGKRHAFARSMVGERVSLVVEGRDRSTGLLKGVCGRFVTVLIQSEENLAGEMVSATVDAVDEQGRLIGRLSPR